MRKEKKLKFTSIWTLKAVCLYLLEINLLIVILGKKKEMKCEKRKDAGSKITLGARRARVLYIAKGQKYQ